MNFNILNSVWVIWKNCLEWGEIEYYFYLKWVIVVYFINFFMFEGINLGIKKKKNFEGIRSRFGWGRGFEVRLVLV